MLRMKFSTKLVGAYVYFPQEWNQEAPKIFWTDICMRGYIIAPQTLAHCKGLWEEVALLF